MKVVWDLGTAINNNFHAKIRVQALGSILISRLDAFDLR